MAGAAHPPQAGMAAQPASAYAAQHCLREYLEDAMAVALEAEGRPQSQSQSQSQSKQQSQSQSQRRALEGACAPAHALACAPARRVHVRELARAHGHPRHLYADVHA